MSLCISISFFTLLWIGDYKQAAKSNCGRIKMSAFNCVEISVKFFRQMVSFFSTKLVVP